MAVPGDIKRRNDKFAKNINKRGTKAATNAKKPEDETSLLGNSTTRAILYFMIVLLVGSAIIEVFRLVF